MKKTLFMLAVCLLLVINVKAEEEYTDYVFVCYEKQMGESNDLIKYEPVTFNKFFKEVVTDTTYESEDFISKDYPYMNKFDYKLQSVFSLTNGDIMHILNRNNFGDKIDSLALENISNADLNQVKIYYDGLELSNLEIVNKGLYTIFKFGKTVNPNLLKVELNNLDTTLRLSYNNNYIHQIKASAGKKVIVSYSSDDEYKSNLVKLGLDYDEHKFFVKFYEDIKKLYLFYNIKREYYIDSPSQELFGYTFLEDESYTMYKKFVREKKETKNVNNNLNFKKNDVNNKEVIFLASVKDNFTDNPKQSAFQKPLYEEVPTLENYQKNPEKKGNYFSSDFKKQINLKKPIVYRKINTKQINNKINKLHLLIFTLILCLVLYKLSVKYKYKNAS